MSPAAEILVIILSVALAIFLILGIILLVYLIRLSAEIRKVTETARKTFDHVESAVSGVSRITSPLFIAQFVGGYVNKFLKKSKKKGE